MSTTKSAIYDHGDAHRDPAQDLSLDKLWADVVASCGERIAVTLDGESATYAELDRIASYIAAAILERAAPAGIQPGAIVAICLERSIGMIAAMLAVIKTGAAYLPIDPGYPVARITETLADASPVAVVTSRGLANRLRHVASECVFVDDIRLSNFPSATFVSVSADDPAYVIYTSGSTGRPKGVVVTHRNVARLLSHTEAWFHFAPEDVWTMFHSFAFDFSVWEIWGCLLSGGRLVIVPFAISRSPDEFHALLVREGVTILNQTPSAFSLLDQVDAASPLGRLALRLVIFGGEALAPAMLRGWFERHGDQAPQLINMYGITETTVHVTYRRIFSHDAHHESESVIGETIPDMQIHLLDAQFKPVPDGEEGEICVGGGGVARGYLNRPELTAERFCLDPFSEPGTRLSGRRLYRSGDLARRRKDGELVFLGRRDSQVKINGFRIELGEIESALLGHPEVAQACVVTYAEPQAAPRLAAYYVVVPGRELATRELSEFLSTRLPAQMMPAFYQRLAVFPLTPNSKVDRSALPAPSAGSGLPDRRSPDTTTSLEDLVAGIWRVVLSAKTVALDENFFDVGGTSLLLIAVRTGLQEQLDRQIPVTWMFECTTIRTLAARLGESAESGGTQDQARQDRAQKQRMAFARARATAGANRGAAQ